MFRELLVPSDKKICCTVQCLGVTALESAIHFSVYYFGYIENC